jgi:hypothetical protein
MRYILLLLPIIAACAQQAPAAPPASAGSTCNAGPAQFAVGQVYSERVGDEARLRSGARFLRVVREGQVVTMEFNAERLTVQLDGGQRVQAARCG